MDLFGKNNFEPGLGPTKPKNWFIAGTEICIKICLMLHHWNPTKNEIKVWLDRNIHKFAAQENRNPRLTKEQWLDRYLYTEIDEFFLCSFPIELYEIFLCSFSIELYEQMNKEGGGSMIQ